MSVATDETSQIFKILALPSMKSEIILNNIM